MRFAIGRNWAIIGGKKDKLTEVATMVVAEEICPVCKKSVDDCICCPECGHVCVMNEGELYCPVCGPVKPSDEGEP